jgi:hypothetical protein
MGMVGLAAAFATLSAQDVPGQRDQKAQPMTGGWEVRVYLMDKDKKDVDLKDITATLMIEEKGMTPAEKPTVKKTIPMQLMTPKADEKMSGWHHGQMREVNGGGQWWCEMVVWKPGMMRKGATEKGEGGEKYGAKEKGTQEGEKYGTKEGMTRTHTGSYFKAEVPADAAPKGEWMASVTFTIKGETKTARGFQYPFMEKEQMHKFREDLKTLEKNINAGDWTQCSAMVNKMVDMMKTENVKEHDVQCWTLANDLKAACDAKDKTKALDAVRKLEDHVEKEHREEYKGDEHKKDDYKK